MKLLILILSFIYLQTSIVQAQCCPYIQGLEIIPVNPTTSDSIYLVTNVTTPNQGSYLGYTIENASSNVIKVRACYWSGSATALQDFTDTINLGKKAMGIYTIDFTAVSSIADTSCVPDDSTSTNISFEVKGTNAMQEQEAFQVTCFPNPLKGQELHISSENQIKKITIIDVLGKELVHLEALRSTKQVVRIDQLMAGNYWVKIIDHQDQSTIKKIVKVQ